MNLRRLRLFLETAAEGSVSRTARANGLAQPALTRHIHHLEAEIGAQLFRRSPRGLRLTETGQFLKDTLELPLIEIETALRSARSYSTQVKASLTIGLPPGISDLFGTRLVTRLRNELPNVMLRIVEEDSVKLAFDLSRRLVDAAILISVIPEQRVSHAQVLSEPMMLVGAPQSKALCDGGFPLARLDELPLILPSTPSGLRINLARAAESAGINVMPTLEIDSLQLIKQLVARGEGFTVLPRREFRAEAENGMVVGCPIVEPLLSQPVLWAVKPDWRLPRAVYNELERVVFDEWFDAVTSGDWQAEWVFNFDLLSTPIAQS